MDEPWLAFEVSGSTLSVTLTQRAKDDTARLERSVFDLHNALQRIPEAFRDGAKQALVDAIISGKPLTIDGNRPE